MIKSILRKWLGVSDHDHNDYLLKADLKSSVVQTQEVRDLVVETVAEAFTDVPDRGLVYFGNDYWNHINGTVRGHTVDIVHKKAQTSVNAAISEIVDPEEFIDAIIQRIKIKQL